MAVPQHSAHMFRLLNACMNMCAPTPTYLSYFISPLDTTSHPLYSSVGSFLYKCGSITTGWWILYFVFMYKHTVLIVPNYNSVSLLLQNIKRRFVTLLVSILVSFHGSS